MSPRADAIALVASFLILCSCDAQTESHKEPSLVATTIVAGMTPSSQAMPATAVSDNIPFTITSTVTTVSPRVLWKSGPTYDLRWTAPAIANGTLYGFSASALNALDASTGDYLWYFPVEPFGSTTPLVSDGVVYITVPGNPEFSSLGMKDSATVSAIDAATHKERWSLSLNEKDVTDPVVDNGTVYCAGHGLALPNEHPGGRVYAIDAANGSLKWKVVMTKSVRTVLVGDEGLVFFGGGDEYLYAVDANNGQQKWEVELSSSDTQVAAIHKDLVYAFSSDGNSVSIPNHLFAVDRLTGKKKWTYEKSDARVEGITIVGDDLFVTTQPILVNCVTGPDCLTPETNRGTINILDAETGQEKRRIILEGRVSGAPIVSDGALYMEIETVNFKQIFFRDGHMVALDIASGAEKWRYTTESAGNFGQPLLQDGIIYVGDDSGAVFALQNP
jgi:outer membrane protein assembly factor BamB